MKKVLLQLIVIIVFLFIGVKSGIATPKATDILNRIDEGLRQKNDVTAKVNIVQKSKTKGVKDLKFLVFRKDSLDSFLMIFLSPETEKGNGYLKVGDNFWMYRRNTRTFQHISRDEDVSGTNMKMGDMEKKKLTELYKPETDENGNEILKKEMLGKIPVYKFTIKAKVNDVTYPKIIYWVRRDNFLPLKEQDFSLSGTLLRTSYYIKYTKIGGKYFLLKGLFVDEFEKGNKSLMNISNISTKPIEKTVFTKGYLENLSK